MLYIGLKAIANFTESVLPMQKIKPVQSTAF